MAVTARATRTFHVLRILRVRTILTGPGISHVASALGTTIEARAVIIVTLADNLPTADNDTTMTIMKR